MKNDRKTGTLRVVLDTNVVVSALHFPKGTLSTVWGLLLEGKYRLVLSPSIVEEIAGILRGRFLWREEETRNILKILVRKADVVRVESILEVVPDDPKDNHIVACALAGKANLIVSGDKDLLRLKEYEGIPIVRPMDFLRTLGK
ncbi:MAG: putative toxin-antitoxin system toxin component, PIN family [Nitrosomonas ureae]